jgi:penicillin-binding protein 1C
VAVRNGLFATAQTPERFLEDRTFLELSPKYAAWQAAQDLPRLPAGPSPLGEERTLSTTWAVAATGTPRYLGSTQSTVRITSPEPDLRVLRDPETPAQHATIALTAVVDPPTDQLVWYVDGAPYRVADAPYTVRWRLTPGEHVFQARLPFVETASVPVRVTVH